MTQRAVSSYGLRPLGLFLWKLSNKWSKFSPGLIIRDELVISHRTMTTNGIGVVEFYPVADVAGYVGLSESPSDCRVS